jgi:hypothetical protein
MPARIILDELSDDSPEVIGDTATSVLIEISKAELAKHEHFLEMLLAIARRTPR